MNLQESQPTLDISDYERIYHAATYEAKISTKNTYKPRLFNSIFDRMVAEEIAKKRRGHEN